MKESINGLFLTAMVTLATAAGLLSGCNTMQGAGKDVEAAGNAVQRESCEHNGTTTKDCSPHP